MAAVAKKKNAGQSGERKSGSSRQTEPYLVTGATGVADAIDAAVAAATAAGEDTIVSGGETLKMVGVTWEFVAEAPDGSEQVYEVTLEYGPYNVYVTSPEGTTRVTYTTAGGTIHTAIATTETIYSASGSPPDYHHLIGVQEDSVDGVDIPAPVFKLTVTVVFDPQAAAGTAHALPAPGDVFWLTGKSNDAPFAVKDDVTNELYAFQTGEVTFLGGHHGDVRPDGKVEITFDFEASPNLTNITVGDITGIDKLGSQYMWVRWREDRQGTGANRVTVRKPLHVIVNDVTANGGLVDGDFALLNIPVPP